MPVFDLSSVLFLHLYFIRVLELASGYRLAVTGWSQPCQSLPERIKIFQKLTVLLSLKLTPFLIELLVNIIGHSSIAVRSVGHGRWAFCLLLLSLPWSYRLSLILLSS